MRFFLPLFVEAATGMLYHLGGRLQAAACFYRQ